MQLIADHRDFTQAMPDGYLNIIAMMRRISKIMKERRASAQEVARVLGYETSLFDDIDGRRAERANADDVASLLRRLEG